VTVDPGVPSVPDAPRVRVRTADGVGHVALARPEKKNALDRRTAVELYAALKRLDADGAVRVIALAGDGDDFCAGADLEALERMLDAGAEAHRIDAEALGKVFVALRGLMKPTVAVVRGRALAGGAGLANASDIVLAHEAAQFGYPEVRVGFVPAMVMTMLRRSVGEKRAAELVLTGRTIGAREALEMGLVSRVLPADGFDAAVAEVLQGLARSPELPLAHTKRLLYHLDGLGFRDGVAAGVRVNVEARSTEAFREGVRRFVRRPSPARPSAGEEGR
jgi:methylglutaconyl-CoA hydratase